MELCVEQKSVKKFMLEITAPAKLNLFLDVLDIRPDGYHNILSVFQTILLSDKISFSLSEEKTSLSCNNPNVPVDESNLILKAVNLLKKNIHCQT